MARIKHSQVCTANHLLTGAVVYLTSNGSWSETLSEAAVAETASEGAELLARGAEQHSEIVGAYLADVQISEEGNPLPVHFREAFRTRGPSNYFHGKQAEA